ncbi:hypothetical protein KXD40_007871 [Peronospora effusa]|uniref:Uncharacterized protein n=1 Tax=Peronospora effusa TaxID=542832 RepID=A0A3M6V9T3_9STRA|nr:hypothetical protein DD238_008255 [Peronospora effusa]UIZ23651.1 hypothetical protein KXD40_007871 [Peronospora effusa]CAI5703729.1 unnamed protein product [Peronospora effusa]
MDSKESSFRFDDIDSTSQTITKRLRSSLIHDDISAALNETKRPRGRPQMSDKAALTATHELRLLRLQVGAMEEELRGLQSKWHKHLPDARILATAKQSAHKKRAVAQIQATQMELQEMILQQQLMFATLQTAIFRAPLHSSGQDILKSLHFNTQFGRDTVERSKTLMAHNERSRATVPSMMKRFTTMAVNKVLALQDKDGPVNRPMLPISQIDVTGCKDYTLVSSVFMSEIPHSSLENVYAAALAYHDAISTIMKRHFGVNAELTRLNSIDAPAAYWLLALDGGGIPSTVKHIMCSELTPSHGMIHLDAVIDDPLHPVSQTSKLKFGISGLTLTPRKDRTGKIVAVTLRWVVLYRYKMLPDDPALRKDLDLNRPILNGDLITASVCTYLQQLKQRQKSEGHSNNSS